MAYQGLRLGADDPVVTVFSSSANAVERWLVGEEHALDVSPSGAEQEGRRLPSDAGDVRRQQQSARRSALQRQERVVAGGRLGRIDVNGGTSEVPRTQAVGESFF